MYVFLIEIMIVGNLKEKFLFFRKIYESLMPDFIVTKEKIIKAKLIVEGIIKKWLFVLLKNNVINYNFD